MSRIATESNGHPLVAAHWGIGWRNDEASYNERWSLIIASPGAVSDEVREATEAFLADIYGPLPA